ncbi:MAG: nucleotidyltransferase [Clostridiaceae bacterium]|jgi:predicted nucleotidyltransferase|nr:nucleotidyltransferase [Clostridiaceae bacterium]
MKVLGIVSEYNPFHLGHVYHIEESIKRTGATHTICVMSGNFVQRGEPAIVDKWARTKMALNGGIDLVLELPVVFACASAEIFAYGAVRTLHSTGIVDYLSFGSEQGELGSLWRIASVLYDEPTEYKEHLKKYLGLGFSFPIARDKALTSILRELPDNIMSKSNNILAIEYLKALKNLKSSIQPITLKRRGSVYTDNTLNSSYSSASAIRLFLKNGGQLTDPILNNNLPQYVIDIMEQELQKRRGPVFPDAFEGIILQLLRMSSPEILQQIPDVNEGLENRLISCALNSGTLDELINLVTTSRYPTSRIKRITSNLLWSIKKKDLQMFINDDTCGYLRVLGFNNKGRELLARIQNESTRPLVVKVANYKKQMSDLSKTMFEYDIKATNSYVLGFDEPKQRIGGQDFTMPIEMIW